PLPRLRDDLLQVDLMPSRIRVGLRAERQRPARIGMVSIADRSELLPCRVLAQSALQYGPRVQRLHPLPSQRLNAPGVQHPSVAQTSGAPYGSALSGESGRCLVTLVAGSSK